MIHGVSWNFSSSIGSEVESQKEEKFQIDLMVRMNFIPKKNLFHLSSL